MSQLGRVLVMGATGKMGQALMEALAEHADLRGTSSADVDARDLDRVSKLVADVQPNILINCVAEMGIDHCEAHPERAFELNTVFPKKLAHLSEDAGFALVHFSTDAVFPDRVEGAFGEADAPHPRNVYGVTKYGGDCMVQALSEKHYIFRVPMLFGPSTRAPQFLERMLERARQGLDLSISNDVFCSPTYSTDVAQRIRETLLERKPYGLYHTANAGKASLYDLVRFALNACGLKTPVHAVSHAVFKTQGLKNLSTPLTSTSHPLMRPWGDALEEYCEHLRRGWE